MRQASHTLEFMTRQRGAMQISDRLREFVNETGIRQGLLTVFCRHTSASLLIMENADPEVLHDLERFFHHLVPDDSSRFKHDVEGPDDMPAHVRTALLPSQLSIPVVDGRLVLGTWQGVFLYEHRLASLRREVVLHLIGE